jgi:hypothetical protein
MTVHLEFLIANSYLSIEQISIIVDSLPSFFVFFSQGLDGLETFEPNNDASYKGTKLLK